MMLRSLGDFTKKRRDYNKNRRIFINESGEYVTQNFGIKNQKGFAVQEEKKHIILCV